MHPSPVAATTRRVVRDSGLPAPFVPPTYAASFVVPPSPPPASPPAAAALAQLPCAVSPSSPPPRPSRTSGLLGQVGAVRPVDSASPAGTHFSSSSPSPSPRSRSRSCHPISFRAASPCLLCRRLLLPHAARALRRRRHSPSAPRGQLPGRRAPEVWWPWGPCTRSASTSTIRVRRGPCGGYLRALTSAELGL